jgi:hypothetical protein
VDLPKALSINAWTGTESPSSAPGAHALKWGLKKRAEPPEDTLAPPPEEPWNWRDPEVGWGLVVPENTAIDATLRWTAVDQPEPIQKLLASRPGSPVLRYISGENAHLRRYRENGTHQDPALVGGDRGVKPGALPWYLLIYAPPSTIPWEFQYTANMSAYVGRLALEGVALDRYVNALMSEWKGTAIDPRAPIVWSANHGAPDISWLMDAAISQKTFAAWATDADLKNRASCFNADATAATLIATLEARKPALIVTTSHGMTGPLDDAPKMREDLGLLVDVNHDLLRTGPLLHTWQPGGAIWYSHACCSAGSDEVSTYADLLDPGSSVLNTINAVARNCGAAIAPLPIALLGAEEPLAAFVGHVEPTFDWTLRDKETGQPLTHSLRNALYQRIYQQKNRVPIGYAMSRVYADAGAFLAQWAKAYADVNANVPKARERALYLQLVALDRMQTVILGDPTVSLPLFA